MAVFDPNQFEPFHKFFPELTVTQTENTLLFSVGISQSDIATLRQVSPVTIRKSLMEAQERLSLFSLSALRSVVQVRLMIPILSASFNVPGTRASLSFLRHESSSSTAVRQKLMN